MTFCSLSPRIAVLIATATLAQASLSAQVSLSTAVDLALRNSPRIKSSEADVARARAVHEQAQDVFIPSLQAGAALGQAYGYSPYPPTLFQLNSSSILYSSSQFSYIHSASAGIDAAQRSLEDTREIVAEDTALAYLALQHDSAREAILAEQLSAANKLVSIVEDRVSAGTDSAVDLTDARLTAANVHLARLKATDDTAYDREHLARLIGIPAGGLSVAADFPAAPVPTLTLANGLPNHSVAAAFANARAKQLQARGDSRFLYLPQISFLAQYQRYATFTNAFAQLENQYNNQLGANNEVIGVQISVPLFDRLRQAKGVESTAIANKALHDAEFAQSSVLDAQSRIAHSIDILQAQADVASLEQQRAQQQLETLQLQMQTPGSTPVPMTPKDEQNAHIAERQKYLAVLDAAYQLHQTQITLLRQTDQLETWILHSGPTPAGLVPPTLSAPPAP
jgi:outer membrane protein TolC